MPLVFVHGVATRPSPEYAAEVTQRDALFRQIVMGPDAVIKNPDWGSHAVDFSINLPWLPVPGAAQAYSAGDAFGGTLTLSLGTLAKNDAAEAVDLAIAAMLEHAIRDAAAQGQAALAASPKIIALAKAAASFLDAKAPDETPKGAQALKSTDNDAFAAALESQLKLSGDLQAYGAIGDAIKGGFQTLGGWIGNGLSDAALKAKRADLSKFVAFFLGDVFIYLRQREVAGPTGVQARLFKPILDDLIAAWKAPRPATEPFVVVGHSLGGVILFDILTDPTALARLDAEAPGLKIDLLATVGSQPGFFADLKLYNGKAAAGGKLVKPGKVRVWHNVFDYTDVFSFLAAPMFNDVVDYSYNSAVDLFAAHTAYFKRVSFYQRLRARLPASA
jgi:hypothetical protein